jgi:hypothetical protein
MTKWWKCDLQVATPAWHFRMPSSPAFDITNDEGRRAFADHYMQGLVARGVDVIALADHNTGEWIDVMVEAGKRANVVVFPGCEVTTGSGADGIHLIIIGDPSKTSQDFDRLLAGAVGFNDDHPRFHTHGGNLVPGSSGKSLQQILDDLPDDFLVIAPHALGQNGIASGNTAVGDIRWKALHHPHLAAVDAGDCSSSGSGTFNDSFRNRSLDRFPCLKTLAFVYTSDAYSIADLGSRFSWIRMEEEPTLEGLRQAFVDHEARIICSWDERLAGYAERNPNNIKHGWLKCVELNGELGNSRLPLAVRFHPGLNVIIGGRGSGKSTVVAAIRQLYSGFATLPQMVKEEAEVFSATIFSQAELAAVHCIQNSQEEQKATWTNAAGSTTQPAAGPGITTSFRVRVVNQKELFERVSRDRSDPLSASRSFLAFVDESLALLKTDPVQPGSWWRRFEDASAEWMASTRELQKVKLDLAQLPTVRAHIRELEAQVAAFDSPEAKARRERNEAQFRDRDSLAEREASLREFLDTILQLAIAERDSPHAQPLSADAAAFESELSDVEGAVRRELRRVNEEALALIDGWRQRVNSSAWSEAITAAEADDRAYIDELRDKGIDPAAYAEVKRQLSDQQLLEKTLGLRELKLEAVRLRADEAWAKVQELQRERRDKRTHLLQEVSARSGRLKFELRSHRDVFGWTKAVRELLNLRSDGFLDDVPSLASWMWGPPDDATRDVRWAAWRAGLISGTLAEFASRENADLRATWQNRLESLDETLRLRLAVEFADDIVQISFLRDGGTLSRNEDWQDITQGSPGQRTAAMLGFVLHHGEEPLILDQPEDDLDTEWISRLVVRELRASRWHRQIVVVTHNANVPVNGDAERVIVLENINGALQIRESTALNAGTPQRVLHCGAIERKPVREDIQNIMEGGILAFVQREKRYNNEVRITSEIDPS